MVWVMTRSYDYEGSEVVAVFASLEAAKAVRQIESNGITRVVDGEWRQSPNTNYPDVWVCDCSEGCDGMAIEPFEVQS
jgi:hypothetical protein